MRPSRRRAGSAVMVTATLGLTACGGDGESATGTGGFSANSGASGSSGSGAGGTSAGGGASGSGGTLILDGGGDGAGGSAAGPNLKSDVKVIITADNAYGFGYGTAASMLNYFGGVENVTADSIFECPVGNGPEQYVVPAANANVGGFLYVVTWADRSTTQGVLAKFFREGAAPVFTGNGKWEVCATGVDYDLGSGGPTLDVINAQLTACNGGASDPGTTSGGWVGATASARGSVAFGEDNSTPRGSPTPGNEFPIVCEIEPGARWMWFEWEANRTTGSPFIWPGGPGNPTKDFLIFRLGAEFVPDPPT